MNFRTKQKTLQIILLACLSLLISKLDLGAQINPTLNYQGVMTELDGSTMDDQAMPITFQIYGDENSNLALWSETQEVDIADGVLNVELGIVNPLDIDFNQPLWLGLSIDNGQAFSPRTKLTGSSHSFTALTVAPGAVVQSINGLKDDVEIDAGENVSITRDGKKLIISAVGGNGGGGDITGVRAGEGLMGGGNQGEVRLSIAEGGISGNLLANNAINSAKIADESIQNSDIRNETLTGNKIAGSQVVKSINGIKDEVELVEGNNIDIKRDGNRIRISAEDSDGELGTIKGGKGIKVVSERDRQIVSLLTPLVLREMTQGPLFDLENSDGPALKATNRSATAELGASESHAFLARHGRNTQVQLAEADRAALFQRFPGINVSLCQNSGALFANHDEYGTSAILGSSIAAVFGASTSQRPAGLFRGTLSVEGSGVIHGDFRVLGDVISPITFTNKGAGAVLMNFNIDRTWQLRQFGSGAGTALELASVSGGGNKNFLISTDGLVGIGTTAPSAKLHVNGNIRANSFNQSSSKRWKKDIKNIEGALELVDQLQGVSYRWKEDERADIGLIAEEVGAIVPQVVEFEENGVDARSIDYARLVPLLIESIKELKTEVDKLKNQ